MAGKKKEDSDPLDAYRRLRKRVPPPSRQIPDRRKKAKEEMEKREADEDRRR